MQTNVLEAKNRLSQLLKAAQAGEEVIIANRGKPIVRLEPVEPEAAGTLKRGTAEAILRCLAEHPLPKYARRSATEIEASIRDARESWD